MKNSRGGTGKKGQSKGVTNPTAFVEELASPEKTLAEFAEIDSEMNPTEVFGTSTTPSNNKAIETEQSSDVLKIQVASTVDRNVKKHELSIRFSPEKLSELMVEKGNTLPGTKQQQIQIARMFLEDRPEWFAQFQKKQGVHEIEKITLAEISPQKPTADETHK